MPASQLPSLLFPPPFPFRRLLPSPATTTCSPAFSVHITPNSFLFPPSSLPPFLLSLPIPEPPIRSNARGRFFPPLFFLRGRQCRAKQLEEGEEEGSKSLAAEAVVALPACIAIPPFFLVPILPPPFQPAFGGGGALRSLPPFQQWKGRAASTYATRGAYTPPPPASAIQCEMVLSIPPWAKRGAREQGQLRDRQHRMREEKRSTQHRKLEGTSSFSTSSSRTNTAFNSWRRKWTNCFPSRCTKNRLHLFHKFIPPTLTRVTRPARGHNNSLHFPPPPL